MTVDIPTVVPLSPGLGKRFYEVVIFLYCFIIVNHRNKNTTEPDLDTATGKSPADEFFCFVNKLGQICDSRPSDHGDTITAFAVLQPGPIQYRFASNNRSNAELETVKSYITDVLGTLGRASDDQLEAVREEIVSKVVTFNKPRIEHHATELLKELEFCIEVCDGEDTNPAQTAARNLRTIQQLARSVTSTNGRPNNDEFSISAINLLNTLSTLHCPSSSFETFTRVKSRQDSDPRARTPWSELRHHLGRLQSYSIAITVLLSLRRHRPALFDDFYVVFVPSTPPLDESTPNIRRSAEGIIKRMPTNIQQAYRACSSTLPLPELDKAIKNAARETNFQPIVHCEVNLFDSILRDTAQSRGSSNQDSEYLRFYGEETWGRYIGCSKPTCRLCALYFAGHPTEVKVRPSHNNVYYKWRAPDVFWGETGEVVASKRREDILEGMVKQIRNVLLESLGGLVSRKAHDSLTTPSNPYPVLGMGSSSSSLSVRRNGYGNGAAEGEGSVLGDVDADDLAERIGEMGI